MTTVTGGQLVAEALVEKEVETIFTLSGGHITPIYQFLEDTDITLFDTRHEQAALFMAEAWGKMTRKPAVAMVTAGPGFTNALTGVASAFFSNTPMVVIAGCVGLEHKEKLDLQDMFQDPVIAPMVKKTLVCQKTERVSEFVAMAFRIAGSGRPGPVYLEFPVDVLNTVIEREAAKKIETVIESKPVDLVGAEKMLEMIGTAEKPVVIAGTGVWQAGAEEELVAFAEQTGLPTHVLRFWETCFSQLSPGKSRGGHRRYQRKDIDLVMRIKQLVHEQGFTIQGAQRKLTQERSGFTVRQLHQELEEVLGILEQS
jgi:acetolactate synthase-1/2/3 large subunit